MIILLWLALALVPWLLGAGILIVIYGKSSRIICMTDAWITGGMCCIGVSEVLHLMGTFGHLSLSRLIPLWHGGIALLSAAALALAAGTYRRNRERFRILPEKGGSVVLPVIFLIMGLIQAIYVFCMPALTVSGDIMVETLCSFQASDGIYQVNPLTGQAYTQGLSISHRIQGLPTLYTILATSFHVEGAVFVQNLIPVVVLAGAYMAYYRIARLLFGDDLRKKYLFLIIVALIFWCGENAPWLDGYAALHSAWLGSSIRNLILLPYALSLGLEKDLRHTWAGMALCVLTEACVCRTFYGLGMCFLLLAVLPVSDKLFGGRKSREGAVMRELLRNALHGPENYFRSNYMIVLALGLLLYFFVSGAELRSIEKRLLRIVSVLMLSVLFPVSAAFLMLYQNRSYSYTWIWSLVPVTIFIAWGSVEALWKTTAQNQRDGRGWRRLATGVAVLLALLLLTGNMGIVQTLGEEEKEQRSRDRQLAAYLQEIPEIEETMLWAPRSVLEEVRRQNIGIRVLYGRNMWDPAAASYAYDTYPMEQQRLFDWMEVIANGENYEVPMGLTIFLEDRAGDEAQSDQSLADAYMLRLAAESGTRIWVFPAEQSERIEQACQQLSEKYDGHVQIIGEAADYMIWLCD